MIFYDFNILIQMKIIFYKIIGILASIRVETVLVVVIVDAGIFIEGLGCVLTGLWGSGSGTTSYSENVGAIGITKASLILKSLSFIHISMFTA